MIKTYKIGQNIKLKRNLDFEKWPMCMYSLRLYISLSNVILQCLIAESLWGTIDFLNLT